MSLGSRIATRGRAAIRANLASTPREPLLFLYPQWIRNSSTASPGTTVNRDDEHTKPSTRISPDPPSPTAVSDDPAYEEYYTHKEERPNCQSANTPCEPASLDESQPVPQESRIRNADIDQRRSRHVKTVVSVPIGSKIRRLVMSAEKSKESKLSKEAFRKAYQAWKREELRSWLPDWRVILADLVKHTPQHGKWLENALIVKVPESSLAKLLSGIDDNMWDIGSRYDCAVQMGSRGDDSLSFRTFIISGPATSISKTTADVLRIAPYAEIKACSKALPQGAGKVTKVDLDISHGSHDGRARHVVSERRRKIMRLPAHKIPRPEKWDVTSFAHYVEDLTCSNVPNHLHRFMYKRGEDHPTAVRDILRDLFADPQCKSSISRTAYNKAMAYYIKTHQIEEARVLFVRMEMMKLQMDTKTFNIFLQGAAKEGDLHNVHFVLHLMLRRGLAPNAYTWISFMSCVTDLRIQLYILAAMREKGLLQSLTALRAVCELLVGPEIEASLDKLQNQEQFLTHMDSCYGPHWLTADSAARILHSLGARGLISRCWDFFSVMDSRFVQLDNYAVNTVLHHCKQGENLQGAIEVLQSLPHRNNFMADEETHRILFEIAWRSQCYNLVRVVWRYACLSTSTNLRMRSLVYENLKSGIEGMGPETPRQRFHRLAGAVIIGRNHFGEHPSQLFKGYRAVGELVNEKRLEQEIHSDGEPEALMPFLHFKNKNRDLAKQAPAFESKPTRKPPFSIPASNTSLPTANQFRLRKLMDNDYSVFKSWRPVKPFSEMLIKAHKRDVEWKVAEREAGKKMDLMDMMRSAIKVSVKTKSSKNISDLEWV